MVKFSSAQIIIMEQLCDGRKRILLPKYTHWQDVDFRYAIDDLTARGFLNNDGLTFKGRWLGHSYVKRKDIIIEDTAQTGWVYKISKDTTIVIGCHFLRVSFIDGFEIGQYEK
jgi:hypothetical protein